MQEIRTSSLARVVCDCMDDVEKLQPFLFLQPDTLANVRQGRLFCRKIERKKAFFCSKHLYFDP